MSPDREAMKERARAVYDSVPRPLRRVSVLLLGMALVVAGVALLVLPGPGLLVLGLAVAVLALEFDWAKRVAERATSLFRRLRSRFDPSRKEGPGPKEGSSAASSAGPATSPSAVERAE
jgi:uncharacterized protein (TIGR02611 family)